MDASREMSIRPDGGDWLFFFDDGRFFHRLDLSRGTCEVGHPCRDDQYEGGYQATGDAERPEFTTEWRVSGPAKDQLIFTRYRRTAHR